MISRDPLDGIPGTPTQANPYHYADNDPLNKTDPLGLRPPDTALSSVAYSYGLVPEPRCVWDVFPWCPGYGGVDPSEAAYLLWRTSVEIGGEMEARNSRSSPSPVNDVVGALMAARSVLNGGGLWEGCRTSNAGINVTCVYNDRIATSSNRPGYARGHTIFCFFDKGRCEAEGVITHEFVHVNQYVRYGDVAFVLFEAEIKRHGYWCSKYEIEAFGSVGQAQCDATRN